MSLAGASSVWLGGEGGGLVGGLVEVDFFCDRSSRV